MDGSSGNKKASQVLIGCLPVCRLLLWVGSQQPAWGSRCQAHSKGLVR